MQSEGQFQSKCTPLPWTYRKDTDFRREIGSYSQHDLLVSANVETADLDLTITAGVENIFDTDPPAARLEYSYDPFIGSPLGRTFKLGTKMRF